VDGAAGTGLASELGVSHILVHRVWSRASLKPHRTKKSARDHDSLEQARAVMSTSALG
jgi:hypothetical protein